MKKDGEIKIGEYLIEKFDGGEDIVISKTYEWGESSTMTKSAKICGGDFEGLMSVLFIDPVLDTEITYN